MDTACMTSIKMDTADVNSNVSSSVKDTKIKDSSFNSVLKKQTSETGSYSKSVDNTNVNNNLSSNNSQDDKSKSCSNIASNSNLKNSNSKTNNTESCSNGKVSNSSLNDSDNKVIDKDDKDKIINIISQIENVIQNVLNISPEELKDMMKSLDMTQADLLDSSSIIKLVMMKSQCSSPTDILNNESLSNDVKDMMTQIKSLTEQLPKNIDLDQIKDVINKELMNTSSDSLSDKMINQSSDNLSDISKDSSDSSDKGVIANNNQDTSNKNIVSSNETIDGVDITTTVSNSQSMNGDNSTKDNNQSNQNSQQQFYENQQGSDSTELAPEIKSTPGQQVFDNLKMAVENASQVVSDNQPADVISQLLKQIKTVVKPDTTSMQMQLNPESLGKLDIQVTLKEGILTAQIATQTEAAKHSIESQLSILKEAFQNQGLKVESVEVSAEPKNFENMNMGQESAFANNQNNNSQRSGRRRINLDELNDDNVFDSESDLSEEDVINIDMMAKKGNKVDYTA